MAGLLASREMWSLHSCNWVFRSMLQPSLIIKADDVCLRAQISTHMNGRDFKTRCLSANGLHLRYTYWLHSFAVMFLSVRLLQ